VQSVTPNKRTADDSSNASVFATEMRTDAFLVEATLSGSSNAFGELVERYQDRLFNTLVRVLGSRDDASEVLQDAFVQAYTKLGSFRGSSQFYTWIYRVALNLACSFRRRNTRRRDEQSIEQIRELSGTEPVDKNLQPQQTLVRSEQAEIVQAALLEISDEHRQILVLREMEDCSYETIAEILDLPVGTVRSRLFRARLQLKERLESMFMKEEQLSPRR
jgi:RNA polymerase sigma-70 factor (ECF subfamily)